jgi:hypothetical protein
MHPSDIALVCLSAACFAAWGISELIKRTKWYKNHLVTLILKVPGKPNRHIQLRRSDLDSPSVSITYEYGNVVHTECGIQIPGDGDVKTQESNR